MHGTTGIVMLCIYGLMNLMWYMILGCCWITYGVIWLCFVLPINGIIKLCKNRKYNTQNAFKQENTQTDTPFVHPNGSKYCKRYIQTHNLPSVKSAFWVVFTLILHKNHLFADRHEHLWKLLRVSYGFNSRRDCQARYMACFFLCLPPRVSFLKLHAHIGKYMPVLSKHKNIVAFVF